MCVCVCVVCNVLCVACVCVRVCIGVHRALEKECDRLFWQCHICTLAV